MKRSGMAGSLEIRAACVEAQAGHRVADRSEPIVDLVEQVCPGRRGDDDGHDHEDEGDRRHRRDHPRTQRQAPHGAGDTRNV